MPNRLHFPRLILRRFHLSLRLLMRIRWQTRKRSRWRFLRLTGCSLPILMRCPMHSLMRCHWLNH